MASTTDTNTRVAIVTGAARGIGRAIALRLAADGLDVVVNDIPSQTDQLDALVKEIHSHKCRSLAVTGDMSRENDVENLVNITVEKLGGLDVMVANAGIARNSTLVTTTLEDWEHLQAVNVRSVFLCYKAAAIQMIKQGRGGRIIGASSIAGKKGSAEWGPYCASKFAVRGLTQSASAELGVHGITVNTYAPGIVRTQLWNEVNESRAEHGLSMITPGRGQHTVMDPEDVAGLVSYLVRPESKFVTGQSMNINAGSFFD
ncbi:hypothetical protein JB92DRAFT_2898384 [Gautieria morchelliformis]|nr:hypothetical protein JB92DRAFT_2898384 [Gautieria morchelliformis]